MAENIKGTASQLPHLPDEIHLQILTHLNPLTLWHSIRPIRQLRHEAEKLLTTSFLPSLNLVLTYSLGSGTRHRWYDVRATICLSCTGIDKHNRDFARFEVTAVHPPNYYQRALEKWRPMCARGLGEGMDWLVTREGVTHAVALSKVVSAEDGTVWVDWRELLDGWLGREAVLEAKGLPREVG